MKGLRKELKVILGDEQISEIKFSNVKRDDSREHNAAKIFDIMATGTSGETINIQVKSTYKGYEWLVAREFDSSKNSVVALVHLRDDTAKQPELYFLPGKKANELITRQYPTHSPRISRANVKKHFQDHDFCLIERLLD